MKCLSFAHTELKITVQSVFNRQLEINFRESKETGAQARSREVSLILWALQAKWLWKTLFSMSIWSKKQEREKNRTYMKTESEKQENKELEKISHQKIGNLFFFKTEK